MWSCLGNIEPGDKIVIPPLGRAFTLEVVKTSEVDGTITVKVDGCNTEYIIRVDPSGKFARTEHGQKIMNASGATIDPEALNRKGVKIAPHDLK